MSLTQTNNCRFLLTAFLAVFTSMTVSITHASEVFPYSVGNLWRDKYWLPPLTFYYEDIVLAKMECANYGTGSPFNTFKNYYNVRNNSAGPNDIQATTNKVVRCGVEGGPYNDLTTIVAPITCPAGAQMLFAGSFPSEYPTGCVYPENPKNLGNPKQCVGNPCNPENGNKYQHEIDIASTRNNIGLERSYNSLLSTNEGLGYGWTSSAHLKLQPVGFFMDVLTSVFVVREDGRRLYFSKDSNGVWSGDADVRYKLTDIQSGVRVESVDGGTEEYDSRGRLMFTRDNSGYTRIFEHDPTSGLVSKVSDSNGQSLRFVYNPPDQIVSVIDQANQAINYTYDAKKT